MKVTKWNRVLAGLMSAMMLLSMSYLSACKKNEPKKKSNKNPWAKNMAYYGTMCQFPEQDESKGKSKGKSKDKSVEEEDEKPNTRTQPGPTTSPDPYFDSLPIPSEEEFADNEYFKVIETSQCSEYGDCIHNVVKVTGKQMVTVHVLCYILDENGVELSCYPDTLFLSEGENNILDFVFYGFDIDQKYQFAYEIEDVQLPDENTSARNGVKMNDWHIENNLFLYVTMERIGDYGEDAIFKVVSYRSGKVVDVKSGFFCVYAKELETIGSTQTSLITDVEGGIDHVEFYFEPTFY